MSAVEVCECGSIGAEKVIRLTQCHHRYFLGDRELISVSKILKAICPTDFSGIDPAVLANARMKGILCDTYFSEWLMGEDMWPVRDFERIVEPYFIRDQYKGPQEHAADARVRLEMLMEWWARQGFKAKHVQRILLSESDGIAGQLDVGTEEDIFDVKFVSQLQPAYKLQLGAYLHMDADHFPPRGAANIHVKKDRVELVRYDARKIKTQWRVGLAWYQVKQEI